MPPIRASYKVKHETPQDFEFLGLFSSTPTLAFQLQEITPDGDFIPIFNFWHPTRYGFSVPRQGVGSRRYNSSDLIITNWNSKRDPEADLKQTELLSGISFDNEQVIGAMHLFPYRERVYSSKFPIGSIDFCQGPQWELRDCEDEGYEFVGYCQDLGRILRWDSFPRPPSIQRKFQYFPQRNKLGCKAMLSRGDGFMVATMTETGIEIMYENGALVAEERGEGSGTTDLRTLTLLTGIAVAHHQAWFQSSIS